MKEFNLEAAKAGAEVCTRDGISARIVCFDMKNEISPLLVLVKGDDGEEYPVPYCIDGKNGLGEYGYDLFMNVSKHYGWVNIYYSDDGTLETSKIYNTEDEARDLLSMSRYVATTKIEWEE